MTSRSFYSKLIYLSFVSFTLGQGSTPGWATDLVVPEEREQMRHHHALCKALTEHKFEKHHFMDHEDFATASKRAADHVHQTTLVKAQPHLRVENQPSSSSYSLWSVLGSVIPFYPKTPLSLPPTPSLTPTKGIDSTSDFVLVPNSEPLSPLQSSEPASNSKKIVLSTGNQDFSTRAASSNTPYKIVLGMDGGGGRGLIGANIIKYLEKQTNRDTWEICDSAIGSSIGGIMVLGLTSIQDGKPVMNGQGQVEMFDTDFSNIFPRAWEYNYPAKFWDSVTSLYYSQYNPTYFEELAKKKFRELRIQQSFIPTSITAVNPDQDSPFLFTSYGTSEYETWMVARCTSAAPSKFPSFQPSLNGSIVGQPHLIDGGIWINNPAFQGILQQKEIMEKEKPGSFSMENMVLFSIGTGHAPVRNKLPSDAGTLRAAGPVISAVINSQVRGVEQAMLTLLKEENNFRLNPVLEEEIPLDLLTDTIRRELVEAAETQYEIVEKFIQHPAVRKKLEMPRKNDLY